MTTNAGELFLLAAVICAAFRELDWNPPPFKEGFWLCVLAYALYNVIRPWL